MSQIPFAVFGLCCLFACGQSTDVGLQGVDNTLAGNGNLQASGHFIGTGTLTASACDSACAPTHDETLILLGTQGALQVKVGATHYPVVANGNTVTWRVAVTGGTCNGGGSQVGVLSVTDEGATGTRVNTSVTHCNKATQSCSCTYAMVYTRQST